MNVRMGELKTKIDIRIATMKSSLSLIVLKKIRNSTLGQNAGKGFFKNGHRVLNYLCTALCKKMQHNKIIIRIKWNLMHKRLVLLEINDENQCPKSVFGSVITPCNKFSYTR